MLVTETEDHSPQKVHGHDDIFRANEFNRLYPKTIFHTIQNWVENSDQLYSAYTLYHDFY